MTTNRGFTAYSTPWHIVISMGVLTDVETEDELAFIIGHELSHILLDHHDVQAYVKKQEELVNLSSETAMFAARVDDIKVLKNDGNISIQKQNSASTPKKIV